MEMIYIILYEEETKGLEGPERISTRWPARCHVTHHVHVAELKETAQVTPPPNNFKIVCQLRKLICIKLYTRLYTRLCTKLYTKLYTKLCTKLYTKLCTRLYTRLYTKLCVQRL